MTNTDKDRIRLAEAMGWKWVRLGAEYAWKRPDGGIVGAFRPDTDANDDYAALEWMRNGDEERWNKFVDVLNGQQKNMPWESASYVLGDYACAALKVLNNDK